MKLLEEIHRFYYQMTLHELRLMNHNTLYPNITYNSLLYMDLIAYTDQCTVSKLAQALHISKSAVTAKVGELMRQGLVEKTQSTDDKRVYYLTVRPEVRAEYREQDKAYANAARRLAEDYSPEDIERFGQVMEAYRKYYYMEGQDNA